MLIKLTRINAVPLLVEHTAIQVIDPMKETGGTMVVLLSGVYAPVIEDADFVAARLDDARRCERLMSCVAEILPGLMRSDDLFSGEMPPTADESVNLAARVGVVIAHKAVELAEAKMPTTPKLETPAYTPPKPNAGLTIVAAMPKQH